MLLLLAFLLLSGRLDGEGLDLVLLLRAGEGGEMAIDIQMIERMRLNDAEIEICSLAVFGCRGG